MNAIVMYDSKFGNTERIAKAIGRVLEDGFDVPMKGKLRLGGKAQTGQCQRDHKRRGSEIHLLHRIHPVNGADGCDW